MGLMRMVWLVSVVLAVTSLPAEMMAQAGSSTVTGDRNARHRPGKLHHCPLTTCGRIEDCEGAVVGQRSRDREVRQRPPGGADPLAALTRGVAGEGGCVLGIGLVLGIGVVEVPFGDFLVGGEVGGLSATLVAGHGVHVLAVHHLHRVG